MAKPGGEGIHITALWLTAAETECLNRGKEPLRCFALIREPLPDWPGSNSNPVKETRCDDLDAIKFNELVQSMNDYKSGTLVEGGSFKYLSVNLRLCYYHLTYTSAAECVVPSEHHRGVSNVTNLQKSRDRVEDKTEGLIESRLWSTSSLSSSMQDIR
ncbi:unnamed protein product [Echinostoma caproni]|uniref:Cystatin domain-containing protein n=1 Tax=Echinostoma caproni TaxID=27848 RepID=A0A183ABV7_9TREM|nr:unnamed protein product [Echinostoma caproni]